MGERPSLERCVYQELASRYDRRRWCSRHCVRRKGVAAEGGKEAPLPPGVFCPRRGVLQPLRCR